MITKHFALYHNGERVGGSPVTFTTQDKCLEWAGFHPAEVSSEHFRLGGYEVVEVEPGEAPQFLDDGSDDGLSTRHYPSVEGDGE